MAEIRYTFVATGQGSIITAFEGIGTAAIRSGKQVAKAAKRGTDLQIQQFRRGTAAFKAAEADKVAIAIAGGRAQARARQQSALQKKSFSSDLAAYTANEKKKTAIARSEAKKRMAADRRSSVAGGLGGAGGAGKGGKRRPGSQGGFAASTGGRVARSAISFGVTAAGFAIAGGAAAALRSAVQTDDLVKQLAIRGREPGGATVDPGALKNSFQSVARQTPGATTQGIAEGVGSFVEATGDLEAGKKFAKIFAEFSVATEASMEDIGKAAAQMFDKFDIKSMDDMGEALAVIAVQGKKGAFEVKDFARFAPKILSAAASANLKGLNNKKGLALVGGLTQIIRGGTGSGAQAATSVEQLFRSFGTKSKSIKDKFGIDVFDTDKKTGIQQLKDPKLLLASLVRAGVGKKEELASTFGRQAGRAINALSIKFEKAALATGDVDGAFLDLIDQIDAATAAEGAAGEIKKDLALSQAQTSKQLTAAWESVVQMADKELLPAFAGLVKELPKLMPALTLLTMLFSGLVSIVSTVIEGFVGLLELIPGVELDSTTKARADLELLRNEQALSKATAKIQEPGNVSAADLSKFEAAQKAVAASKAEVEALENKPEDPGLIKGLKSAIGDAVMQSSDTVVGEEGISRAGLQATRDQKAARDKEISERLFSDVGPVLTTGESKPVSPELTAELENFRAKAKTVGDILGFLAGNASKVNDEFSSLGKGRNRPVVNPFD